MQSQTLGSNMALRDFYLFSEVFLGVVWQAVVLGHASLTMVEIVMTLGENLSISEIDTCRFKRSERVVFVW